VILADPQCGRHDGEQNRADGVFFRYDGNDPGIPSLGQ
jgi:hypothetical protein